MNTQEFLQLLKSNQGKELMFEYQTDKYVGANYHITEVKNISVDSVDCGARTDHWKETVVQLWESPKEIGKTEYMTGYKALGILNKVDRMRPMVQDAEIKFEYSNNDFNTAQLFVQGYGITEKALVLNLSIEKTDCKAKDTCGVPVKTQENPKEMANCCTPESGCC
ncbi:DUF6428 family protein [Flagellimonas allohymeniacidonis]|uniref:Uncharacterized protein n=1 Tax=Flagellimonas allohymeniacidonis TaxID=2517819 RepID=A0A4Q8QGJ3_9FLAO|nr:DUF6428 family protein [Allomuricauda hymeniacidonis]TAI47236.1 hypothetical protein EW142_11170 [Allomuricauda hymeniacidonis]